jgi:endoglucanase
MKCSLKLMILACVAALQGEIHGQPSTSIRSIRGANSLTLQWNSTSNSHYRLMKRSSFAGTNMWLAFSNVWGNGNVRSVTMSSTGGIQQFYQFEVRTNPLAGLKLYVNPNSAAQQQVNAWTNSRPQDAAQIWKIAQEPWSRWLTVFDSNVQATVSNRIRAAEATNQTVFFTIFGIPRSNCDTNLGLSFATRTDYTNWIDQIRRGIQGRKAVFILEPFSLANIDCLHPSNQIVRYAILRDAVRILRTEPGAIVYLDGGHSRWQSNYFMIERLQMAGVTNAHGFALNAGNFIADEEIIPYGESISAGLADAHFVVDTSRNGLGPEPGGQLCNPPGRALGRKPMTSTTHPLIDGFLWIKPPGESDGTCNGGPDAGTFWADYALGLAERAAY